MFGSLALFVLGLAAVIVPSLTSTSINGERDRGTLAVLQATLYRPHRIYGAKFAAALITAGVFLVVTIPLGVWSFTEGDVGVGRVLMVYVVLVVASALFIAVGLAASALVQRPALSAMAAYAFIFLLTIGSPILYGLSLLSAEQQVRQVEIRGGEGTFTEVTQEIGPRWLLLAPNPFVVLADASPRTSERIDDPLSAIREAARTSRETQGSVVFRREGEPPALWPAGLVIDLGLLALAAFLTLRKLQIPARRLARGQRVA